MQSAYQCSSFFSPPPTPVPFSTTLQVLVTAVLVGLAVHLLCGLSGPASIVIGNGLALSSTAVVLQVQTEGSEWTDGP